MRALVLASLAKGTSRIHNYLLSPDVDHMIEALRKLGARVEKKQSIEVQGGLSPKAGTIDAGNSGIVYRFAGALAALGNERIELTGDDSIRNRRPISPLLSGVEQLGGETGKVWVKGPLCSGRAKLDGALSQPVSALLIAATALEGETELEVTNPGEQPWIEVTLHWLRKMKVDVTHTNYEKYRVKGCALQPFETTIPADWSSAAFPIAAALVTHSPLQIEGLDLDDVQGDKMIAQWFSSHLRGNLFVEPGPILGGTFDMNACIDAVPIMAVIGCFAKAPFHLINAGVARKKECDRLHAITKELRKMGGNVLEFEDRLTIYPSTLHGAHLDSHNDHRMAMALAVAALGTGGCTIENTKCIQKSFPNFVEKFQNIGAKIS